jgi:hypothetical protein
MTSCISRRAFGDHLRFRLINDKGEDGRWIWMEYICDEPVSKDGDSLCIKCSEKISNPESKYQNKHSFNHGNIGCPYTAESKLYGSPYYLAELKKGWKVAEHDEKRAKAAVDKALSRMAPRKKVQLTVEEQPSAPVITEQPSAPVITEQPPERKKRAYNRKKVITETLVAENTGEVAVKAKPVKLKRHRSKKILPTEVLLPQVPVVVAPIDITPKFVEVVAVPITITDFVVVKVKKMKCQGKDYYYDSSSGKIYGISVNGVGAYKGRYKEEEDTIDTTFPDSDDE